MLPCQNQCPYFHPDCHKTCDRWAERQNRQREEKPQTEKTFFGYIISSVPNSFASYRDLCRFAVITVDLL